MMYLSLHGPKDWDDDSFEEENPNMSALAEGLPHGDEDEADKQDEDEAVTGEEETAAPPEPPEDEEEEVDELAALDRLEKAVKEDALSGLDELLEEES